MKTHSLLSLSLHHGKYLDFLSVIKKPDKKTLVFTPNPEIFVRASRDDEFMNILRQATYNVPDGNGLYIGYMMNEWLSFFQSALFTLFQKEKAREKYGELIKGSDVTRDILESWKVFPVKVLIIDKKNPIPKNEFEVRKAEIQRNLKQIIEWKYPGITAFVVFAGEQTPAQIAELIEQEGVQFVFSCIGMKTQEKLLIDIFSYLEESQKVVGFGVGASIDFLLGLQKRAPVFFQNLGLEWFYRLITQPRIRAKRIYDAVVEFPRLVKKSSRIKV